MGFGTISKRNDTFTAFRYRIVAASVSSRRFYVQGDQTQAIKDGETVHVGASIANNGTYTVVSTAYDTSTNQTRVNVAEPFPSSASDGVMDINGIIPWLTGDIVVLNTTKFLPSPFFPNTAYYVIRKSNTRFQLAETYTDAIEGVPIAFTTPGDGFLTVAQVEASFRVFGGAGNTGELWFHYAVDRTDVRSFTPPSTVLGMQTLINMIDGYALYQHDNGISQNIADSNDFDPVTGRLVNWQLETERFIDWAFGLRSSRMVVADSFRVTVSPSTDLFTFTSSTPMWLNGTAISVTSTGTLPAPLVAGSKYFVVLTGTPGEFKVSTSPTASDTDSLIDITSAGSGVITVGLYDKQRAFPRFELNPARNNVWVDTPLGVLSNVITGPYSDIRIQQSIFDQYNRPITSDKLTVYREDKRSLIAVRPELANDVDPIYGNDPYNYIHFGGAHLFVEGYEHFLILNNYTVSGALLYDPFLGLSTKKLNVDYFEKTDYTLRPTLGGYYLVDQKFERNMEGAATDLQHIYDILALSETTDMAKHARALVGYKGRSSFLDLLNVNSKSQFMFYRGMIQSKGSINSVKAYVNSRRFVDAKLDEFWAWKLADFGDSRPKMYPELNLFLSDGKGDIRLEFQGTTEATSEDPDLLEEYEESTAKGFDLVSFSNTERWYESPDQKQRIQSPLFLDAEVSSMISIYSGTTAPTGHQSVVDYWFNTSNSTVSEYDSESDSWVINTMPPMHVNGSTMYFTLPEMCDDIRVVKRVILNGNLNDYTSVPMTADTQFKRINAFNVSFPTSVLSDIITIFTINPASTKVNPARLIDKTSGVILQSVSHWDPARGDHHPYAVRGIDMDRTTDPAHYTASLNTSQGNLINNAWNHAEVGTVWWDKSKAVHKSYFDTKIYSNINDRLRLWGNLAPWGSMDVYQWTESTVPPSEWDALAAKQSTDSSIPHAKKATGTPRKTTFKRSRRRYPYTVISGNRVQTSGNYITEGQIVLFTGRMPAGIETGSKYIASNVTANEFTLVDYETNLPVAITNPPGSDTMYVVPEFVPGDWKKDKQKHVRVPASFAVKHSNVISTYAPAFVFPYALLPVNTPNIAWEVTADELAEWEYETASETPDTVDVYVNYQLIESNLTVQYYTTGSKHYLWVQLSSPLTIFESNIVDIIRPDHTITSQETEFNPDESDDGTILIQWKEDYEHTAYTKTIANTYGESTTRTYYYFWVKGATTRDETVHGSLSINQIATYLEQTPSSYFVMQKPKDDPDQTDVYDSVDFVNEPYKQMPIFYRQLILQKVGSYVDDDRRYTIQFTRDFTLRDNLNEYNRDFNIKDTHEQWVLFRQEQTSTIDYVLWNKLTESLVGYHINNLGEKSRVPSLERELYDATYNTSTRIGLSRDQTFVDRALGLNTVVRYLKDPTHDFSPANIDEFFQAYSFDTPENIRIAMDVIYTTFSSTHVNRIWFETLNDSFALNRKYSDLMKTSWIALHGVRVLEVGGLFDD